MFMLIQWTKNLRMHNIDIKFMISHLNYLVIISDLNYYAVAVKKAGSPVRIDNLKDRNACIPGKYVA